jgi:hypothetical protein
MDKKIKNILDLYENILLNKPSIIEADIKGVDELVYNPVTGVGGEIGYGYNNGVRQKNIKWKGHENHLHIGFTDKKVAMSVIDKADSMGLVTTENPYAKKDPNNKVDNVHTGGSLHYKNFPGTPLVGMAVDISGNKNKIVELIKWIDQNYAGATSTDSITSTDGITSGLSKDIDSSDFDPVLYQIGKNIGSVFSENKITESVSFGKNIQNNYGKIIIPKNSNDKIKSPISGVIENSRYVSSCNNQIIIKIEGNEPKYLQYCGITNPKVKDGDNVFVGQLLGQTDSDVEVTLLNSSFKEISLNKRVNLDSSNKNNDEDIKVKKDMSTKTYSDPVLAYLAQIPFKPFENQYDETGKMKEKRIGYSTDKKSVDPWILNMIKKPFQKKVNENVERIKKLL